MNTTKEEIAMATDEASNENQDNNTDTRRRVHPLRSRGRRKKSKNNKVHPSAKDASVKEHHDYKAKNGNANTNSYYEQDLVALDCEFVGVGPGGFQNALARVSLVDGHGSVLLDTFVKVSHKITDYRTFVSGVRAENLEDAMPFEDARRKVQSLLKEKVLVGHGLVCDLECLKISHPQHRIRDSATYTPFMQWKITSDEKAHVFPRKLRDLVRDMFGVSIQEYASDSGEHSSIEDAYWALQLYKVARNEWERGMKQKPSRSSRRHRKCLHSGEKGRAAAIRVLRA